MNAMSISIYPEWRDPTIELDPSSSAGASFALNVRITVKNTSKRAGAEVVQVYVRDLACSVRRPSKELKGFQKVFLQPGEEKRITLHLDALALSFYDEVEKAWIAEKGAYHILLSTSSSDDAVLHTLRYDLESDISSIGVC